MRLMMLIIIIPLLSFIGFVMYSMMGYGRRYDPIYENAVRSNELWQSMNDFEYSMYQIVIGSSSFEQEDIFHRLDSAEIIIQELRQNSQVTQNVGTTKRMITFIGSLRKSVDVIWSSFLETGNKYDKNLQILDQDIRTTVQLILEKVREYNYNETTQIDIMREQIDRETRGSLTFISLVFFVLIILTMVLITAISNNMIRPIKRLSEMTNQVAKGDFNTRADVTDNDELMTLNKNFNRMVKKISDLVEDIKEEQLNLRKTELRLLQEQINPHFLYNTLENIIWLAEAKEHQKVIEMVSLLSTFFRTSLSEGRDFITVREEERHIESYLKIQKYRYQDIMDYEIKIDDEIKDFTIMKLTLQPIVENALYHGIKNKRGKGMIRIIGTQTEKELIFLVEDNGIGIDEEKQQHLRNLLSGKADSDNIASKGFGLPNVHRRIVLQYGNEYGLSLKSEYGKKTEMQIKLPKIK
jgi:two-component system sensor histidine kinase YesM